MSAYRFCRTDDIALLVEAWNRCWLPYVPGEPPMTAEAFKRLIRDLQVWCSSCMVAFSNADPVGVLIGAKRPGGTLVHTIAVHPDHRRQGHGRHLLASLGSKLAILGPPRIVAEVPEALADACGLFGAAGYEEEEVLIDYVRDGARPVPGAPGGGRYVIPVTLDDLDANGLLDPGGAPVCWARANEALAARKDDIAGLAVASDERIEAYVLYRTGHAASEDGAPAVEFVALRPLVEDGVALVRHLVERIAAGGVTRVRIARVHPAEISRECLDGAGFRPTARYVRFAGTARSA